VLRNFISILFICLMILFHFGKTMNYLNCKLEHIINNNTTPCDCEKQLKNNPENNPSNPLQKLNTRDTTVELFSLEMKNTLPGWIIQKIPALLISDKSGIPAGFNNTIFQPPRI
jgi:hypothetical protein